MTSDSKASPLLQVKFVSIIKNILKENNWDILDEEKQKSDIIASPDNGKTPFIFEVKLTKQNSYSLSNLSFAVNSFIDKTKDYITNRKLVVSSEIQEDIKDKIYKEYRIQVIDLNDLISLSNSQLRHLFDLADLCDFSVFNLSKTTPASDHIVQRNSSRKVELLTEVFEDNQSNYDATSLLLGQKLISNIEHIDSGNHDCHRYEKIMTEALQFIFSEDLGGWHEQKNSDDDLHRFDLVCSIRSSKNLWSFISQNLDSRYIIFEFKNYSKQIGQSQIYSTEKYLYEKAKRKVAFIISQYGANTNAIVAAQGSMREHGKLIINLTNSNIIKFINLKVYGDDPCEELLQIIDDFLIRLPK